MAEPQIKQAIALPDWYAALENLTAKMASVLVALVAAVTMLFLSVGWMDTPASIFIANQLFFPIAIGVMLVAAIHRYLLHKAVSRAKRNAAPLGRTLVINDKLFLLFRYLSVLGVFALAGSGVLVGLTLLFR